MFLLLKITGGLDRSISYLPCHSNDVPLLVSPYWTMVVVAASEYADAIRAAYRLLAKEAM